MLPEALFQFEHHSDLEQLLKSEFEKQGIKDVILTTSGCAGLCSEEPMMTVELKGNEPVKYAALTPDKTRQILEERHWPEQLIRAVISHGWGLCSDVEPLTRMEQSLYAIDELTGLVCDPASGVYVVILTNRAHPNDKGTVKAVRKGVTNIVYQAVQPSTGQGNADNDG